LKTVSAQHNLSDTRTEGIKYAGSKLKIIPQIIDVVSELEITNVLDGFSGSTRVSQIFARMGYNTTSSDISYWSETLAKCYLLADKSTAHYQELIAHLNDVKGIEGWFSAYYGGDSTCTEKRPFQLKNSMKLDGIREEIDKLGLNDIDKSVALTSLILALDSVDSTLGHYVSYLADWSPRSYNDLKLSVPKIIQSNGNHEVLRGDIFLTVENRSFDLAYLDPPYGSNNEKMPPSRVRYASYYHIWKTVILNDQPKIFGKVNRREDTRDKVAASVFEEFRKDDDGKFIAMKSIGELVRKINARYVLLSYSSGGRATKEELVSIINENGKLIKAIEIDFKHNVMANMRWTNDWINSDNKHLEYLFLMEKN